MLPATLDDNGLAGLSEDRSALLGDDTRRRRRPERGCGSPAPLVAGQVRVSSAMAFLAQASSTRLLLSAAAAMRAAAAAPPSTTPVNNPTTLDVRS